MRRSLHRVARVAILALLLGAGSAEAFLIGGPQYQAILEFTNDLTGHYVLLSDPREITGVEAGSAGPGWRFTGYTFRVRIDDTAGERDVCRFYAPSSNSHFFTANPDECASLRQPGTGWIFEGVAFRAPVPVEGICTEGVPVYRQYNNRAAFLDSNHRFDFDGRVRTRMVAAGWADEGIAFCGLLPERATQRFAVAATSGAIASSCERAAAFTESDCVEARQLPALTSTIDKTVGAPSFVISPSWSADYDAQSGWVNSLGRLATAGDVSDPAAVSRRTFIVHGTPEQGVNGMSSELGVHLRGNDRLAGDYADVAAVHRFATLPPLIGSADLRWMPWTGKHDSDLVATFIARSLRFVRRPGSQDHGYGTYGLRLRDANSTKVINVNLLAYGSLPPDDFTGRDVFTGNVIVSTVFRPQPAFGANGGDTFVACAPTCDSTTPRAFRFTIGIDDAREILARAHQVDPELSADPASYLVERFECRSETFRDAEIGASIAGCQLGMSY